MLPRMLALIGFVWICTATSCTADSGIAITPSPGVDSDSAAQRAFSVVERVTARRGLQPYTAPDQQEKTWIRCFAEDVPHNRKLVLCGKMKDREVHFRLYATMIARFTPHADSVRVELLDSLRAEFGAQAARECVWRFEGDSRRSGCPVLTQRDRA